MRRLFITVTLVLIIISLAGYSIATYNSINTPTDVEVVQNGGDLTFSVNADAHTNVDWEISDRINSAAEHVLLNGHTATVNLSPGNYSVTCRITDMKGGVRSVSDSIIVTGEVTRSFSWDYNGMPCEVSMTMDYKDVDSYYSKSVSRGISKEADIYTFIVVDHYIRELSDKLAEKYTLITGMEPVPDSSAYAQYLLAFCQDAIQYVTDSSSRDRSEYWKFPLETLYDTNGDCEDSSILFATLCSASGYSSVGVFLLPSHALGAVSISDGSASGTGTFITMDRNGLTYYAAETTSSSWSLGYTSSSFIDSIPLLYVGHLEL